MALLAADVAVADADAQHEFELVLLAKPDLVNGAALFDKCSACHGPNGEGANDGSVPVIGAQHFKVIARQLVDFRHNMRWDERMTHFNEHHLKNAQDIADVTGFVSALVPAPASERGQSAVNDAGAGLYAGSCASCHGSNADGSARLAIPRLAGQHYEYLLKQMHDVMEGRRPDYSTEHLVLFNHLSQPELADLARYLSKLEPARR